LADGPVDLFDGHLALILSTNRGAFLSIGAELPEYVRTAIFTVFVAIALAAGFVWLIRHPRRSRLETVALALLLGGGLGNVLDRAFRSGAVTDFVLLRIGPLRTGIFNMADVFVTVGALVIFTFGLFQRHEPSTAGDDTPAG
jgi:signal peptidase II